MVDLSLHIQDLYENCFTAGATKVLINIISTSEYYDITILDNGSGMSEETLQKVVSPFTTSRTVRKVGLGIPLFIQTCEQTEGFVTIKSTLGVGTSINGRMYKNHFDAIPLGDLTETIYLLFITNDKVEVGFTYNDFTVNSQELRDILGDVPFTEPSIMEWIKTYITEGISE